MNVTAAKLRSTTTRIETAAVKEVTVERKERRALTQAKQRSLEPTRGPQLNEIQRDAMTIAKLLPEMLCSLGGVDKLSDLGIRPLVASAGKESLFNTLFGRDSIRMAVDLIDSYPKVAKATIIELAKLQGVKVNPKAEEEPGRIIHEFRSPEELEKMLEFEPNIKNWDFPYYGSVDATPTFVSLVGEYVKRHGPAILDEKFPFHGGERTVREAVEAAVGWVQGRLDDPRAGGFLWVQRANPKGIQNQILEDSFDSVYYADGKLHPTTLPYAPVAEQGYAYKALMDAAKMGIGDSAKLEARAQKLKTDFVNAFWQEDLGTFAQAVGFDETGHGTPMRTIASSPGQLLMSGILDDLDDQRTKMVNRLFQPDMLGGAGIRTKSTTAARFIEGGYHNGTVWPTISLEIADGLRRSAEVALKRGNLGDAQDLTARAIDLEDRAIRAMAKFPFFPEFLRGGVDGKIDVNKEVIRKIDRDGHLNTLEQPPQPQGWTTTAMEKVLRRRGLLPQTVVRPSVAA
jgi:glycogen debranching enzyme